MSSLTRTDRLAIRSQVSGTNLNAKQHAKWINQHGFTFQDGKYTKGKDVYNSFEEAYDSIYNDNADATRFRARHENFNKFNSISGLGSGIGNFASEIGSAIGNKFGDDFSEEQKASQSAIRGMLEKIPVVGQIISAASGLVDGIGTATGLNLSNIDKNSAERAGVGGSATFNNIMNMLPGNSMIWGSMGSRTDSFVKSDQINNLGSAYGGTMLDLDAAANLANKRVLFGEDDINSHIDTAKIDQNKMLDINNINSARLKGITSENVSDYNNARNSKYNNPYKFSVGKLGMKLMSIEEVNKILNSRKASDIQEFKNGGVIGIDSSIIPEGKLHAHKHNLKDTNPDLEDVTKKGIPIVTLDKDGELQQVAEIEKEEIIFRKEVTIKLEELYKDGSDEAMIEAGKLIADELMTNTDDKTEEFINE